MKRFIFLLILFLLVSNAISATYYVDKTNGNDTKDGLSEPNAWRNISKVNSMMGRFAAGDHILFKKGETWTTQLIISCSGNANSNITFDGAGYGSGDNALIDVTGAGTPTSYGIIIIGAEYLEVKNFRIKGSGGNNAFGLVSSGDAGNGYTIIVRDVNIISNNEGAGSGDNDGFDLGANCQAKFYDIAAANCLHGNESHQCITGHVNAKYTVDGAVFKNSNYWVTNTEATQATITNMTASGAITRGVAASSATADHLLIISNSTMNFDCGGQSFGVLSGASSALTFVVQNCNLNFTSSTWTNNSAPIQFLNNTWDINDTGFRWQMQDGGVLILIDNRFTFSNSEATTAFSIPAGSSGYIIAQRNVFTINGLGNYLMVLRGDTNPNIISQNIFDGIGNCGTALIYLYDDAYGGIFNNNVFYNASATAKTALNFLHDGDEAINAKATCENNIFYNITDVSTQTANKFDSVSYNCYYNSENMGGTGSITADPQFMDATNGDFRLKPTSPCLNTGKPISGGSYTSIGAWQQPLAGDFVYPDGVEINDLRVLCEQWLSEELSMDVSPDGGDGTVNFLDWAIFAADWQITVDFETLADFADQWLKTGANYYIADIAPAPDGDGIVNMLDFAALANNWLVGVGN